MNRVEIRIVVNSSDDTRKFYCDELGLFSFYYDYGMGTISLKHKLIPNCRLLITEGDVFKTDKPLFGLETDSCDLIFKKIKKIKFETKGKIISENVFEYPLGKNFLMQDPSSNKFIIFEDYYPNIGDEI